jgi:hypothetical protein
MCGRHSAYVEAESEFVEVGLEVLGADAVMSAGEPGLQIGKDEVNNWQIFFGNPGIASPGDSEMFVAALAETGVTGPIVRSNWCACGNSTLDEATERLGAAIGHDCEPNAAGIAASFALVELGTRFVLAQRENVPFLQS